MFVANGRRCGGGMDVAPTGSMHDGWADVTILPDTPTARQLWEARRLYDGSLGQWPGAHTWSYWRSHSVESLRFLLERVEVP